MRQVFLDTETTGLYADQGDRVIEIACVEMVNRKLTGRHFHRYVNPERDSHEEALRIHGITSAFLADKPLFATVAQELLDFATRPSPSAMHAEVVNACIWYLLCTAPRSLLCLGYAAPSAALTTALDAQHLNTTVNRVCTRAWKALRAAYGNAVLMALL
jgi:hypothetical protein